jgi:hypothetical protein
MKEKLTELYRASRPKEALASQDEFKSANALLGSDVEKFAELLLKECIDIANDTRYDGKVVANRIKFVFGIEE